MEIVSPDGKKIVPIESSEIQLKNSSGFKRGPNVEEVDQKFKDMEDSGQTLKLRNLLKTFNDGEKVAVNNLNLDMYNDQISVLLGHNGAGKTTTISMITGMLSPTEGSINVLGRTNIEERRSVMGICPQHDTLYDELTVEEHLYLFGTFKGLEGD